MQYIGSCYLLILLEELNHQRLRNLKMEFFNDDECKVLIQSLMEFTESNLKYKAAILLDIFSGVRRGELIGLEWSDVDFKN